MIRPNLRAASPSIDSPVSNNSNTFFSDLTVSYKATPGVEQNNPKSWKIPNLMPGQEKLEFFV